MDSSTEESEILDACLKIEDKKVQELYFDVFMSLKAGRVDEARNRISLFKDDLVAIEKANQELVKEAKSNDNYLFLDDFRTQDIETILNHSSWFDWMLFMHPAQRKVVERDYKGAARLLGVSGSGKTSVAVNRALRLASKYPEEKILILTLNRALAKLIRELIAHVYEAEGEEPKNIEVKSFWRLCQELLFEFDPVNKRLYDDYTHKTLEDVEAIWMEYYNCEENNDDAYVMAPVHRSLLSRGMYPKSYIKQEFDWIRSILINGDREKYLQIDRVGRKVNFTPDYRRLLLEGLKGWEEKMKFVGVIDYMGLLKPLFNFIPQIEPMYRCILVDELQDFGTSELEIVRKLVKPDENDLFLTGDIAQQVSTKHHSLKQAGINIIPENYLKIYKNYRNSREILEAAFAVFNNNIDKETYSNEDFELLNPEYANFSSPKPFIRKAYDLNTEFTYASKYLEDILKEDQKGCIVFAGINYYDVTHIGSQLGYPVLDGRSDLSKGRIFISDIEQTKGFEFDRVIIINVNKDVIPSPDLPHDEWYREIAKIYVSMTRAKKELILSYSNELSPIFNNAISFFTVNNWEDYFPDISQLEIVKIPSDNSNVSLNSIRKMTGREFLFTKNAIGLSTEAQLKLLEVIRGHKSTLNGEQIEWPELGSFIDEMKSKRQTPKLNRILGKNVYKEIYERFIK
jgi:superfamily I DNA/RNA helicase